MYIATKKFPNTPRGTETTIVYQPGDVIEDFTSWPEHARRNLLSLGWVEPSVATKRAAPVPQDDDVAPAKPPPKRNGRKK